ncbi:hypothetical protein SCHPADRAFT_816698 [Schizopora paradoxa]|uniref:DUF7702 domain-containing protein n=1 Tax=Schizopora paradoxa TaxID=27342 RepID=A0A0H2S705_9AGAM|nr:hypothetical protein SCHPADRAFT_816698 [Schizopora paradoxa]
MGLDQRGDIAIAEIVFYVPILVCALLLTLRHGFGRQAGWIFLFTFSIVRIVGGAIHIAAEEVTPPKTGLFIAAFAIESAGVAPLLLCTSSWLQTRVNHPLFYPHVFRLVRIVLVVAFALAIVGATNATSSNANDRTTGATLRKVGGIIILACFIFMAFVHVLLWTYKSRLYTRHRTLLLGISTALPFLLVRCIYSVLSAFSPVSSFGPVTSSSLPAQHNSLSKFNSFSGSWQIFLVMSLVMEYAVVLIYLTVGAVTPLERGTDDDSEEDLKGGQQGMYQQRPANVNAYDNRQGYAA